jgi:malonyl-CoA O-methyltransferase
MCPPDLSPDEIPAAYAEMAVVARETAVQMRERLSWITLQPEVVIDVHCRTGDSADMLRAHYPAAKIIALDESRRMVNFAKQHHTSEIEWLCAAADNVPFSSQFADVLQANLVLPWYDTMTTLFAEWHRVLRPKGLLMLATFGPDTLRELHDSALALPHFIDMHDVGDALVQAGFLDPVLDVDYVTLTYQDSAQLFRELQVTGMIPIDADPALVAGVLSLTYEIVYAHAWTGAHPAGYRADEAGVVRIPLSGLKSKKKV